MMTRKRMQSQPVTDDELPPDAEWLMSIGAKRQEYGGAFSFFGEDKENRPLLWVDVHPGERPYAKVALVEDKRHMSYFMHTPTRADVRRLLVGLAILPHVTRTEDRT